MTKKNVIIAYISVLFVFAAQIVDMFFIHNDGSLFGGNVVARIIGIVIAIIASIFLKFNIKRICFKRYGWIFEILIGAFFAIGSAALYYGVEYIILKYVKGYANVTVNVSFPNVNDMMSLRGKIFAIGLFCFTVLIEALFKELFFRGFLISQFFKKYGLRKSNIIQSVFYTLIVIPTVLRYLQEGRFVGYGLKMTAFAIGCTLLVDFVSGIKWGLYYRVNGTVWMSVADHFFNHLVLTCIFITHGAMPMKWVVIETLAIQCISFIMFMPLYFSRDRQNEEIAVEVAVRRELAGLHVDDYSPSPVRRYLENKRQQRIEEFARKRNIPVPKPDLRFPKDFEDAVSLKDSNFFSEEQLARSMKEFETQGEQLTEKQENVVLTEENPSEMSDESFEDVDLTEDIEETVEESDEVTENGENISKLIKGFFDENFEKHTY